jgi:DNA invertase Pin-like site-specific DNA recombinase
MAGVRAALALRVSSGRQRDACTIETQRDAGRRLIASHGWTLAGEYVDDGVSAKAGNLARRPGLRRLLDDATAGRFEVVVVYAADRLTRAENQRERGLIIGTLQLARVKIAYSSTGQVIDPTSDEGDFQTTFDTLCAARDNRLRRQRAKDGRSRTAAAGRPPCAPPLGLVYDRAADAWREAPEAELVREIVGRVAGGESCRAVAADLTRRGVELPRGGHWEAASVLRAVRCECYSTGLWRASGEQVITVPVLVDPDLAARARQRLAGYQLQGLRRTCHTYLLEGIAECAICGAPIQIHACVTRRPGGQVYRYSYYQCASRRVPGAPRCGLPPWRTDRADDLIWRGVEEWIAEPELARDALAAREGAGGEDGERARADLADWRRRLEGMTSRELELLDLRDRGLLSRAALGQRLERMQRERALLERQIATAEASLSAAVEESAAAADLRSALGELRAQAGEASPEERREIIGLISPRWSVGWGEIRALEPIDARAAVALRVCAS